MHCMSAALGKNNSKKKSFLQISANLFYVQFLKN